MKEYLQAAKRRKSVRKYSQENLTAEELNKVIAALENCKPLVEGIDTYYKLVPCSETNCRWNGEYCLLFYSEEKPLYLQNAGYILEQWDLQLAAMNIGVCWYGMGSAPKKEDGKIFVMMMCFGKTEENFRTDISEFKRKKLADIWQGEKYLNVAEIAKLAPSAVNTQPWLVKEKGNELEISQQGNLLGTIAKKVSKWFNKMDMGIFLVFLELALEECGYTFTRTLDGKKKLLATYKVYEQ